MRAGRHAGFTLLELLVVVGIIALLASMIAFLPSGSRKQIEVRAAADELAATLRLARGLAVKSRSLHAVVFNVQNGVGTSGLVLNNFDGGHWYRILGPWDKDTTNVSNPPPLPWAPYFRDTYLTMDEFLRGMEVSWIGERHVLTPHRVRFLALSDQDNGGYIQPGNGADGRNNFPPTWPRPWCGWWDSATKRLYPWGGYDHDLVNPQRSGRCNAGFWYEGNDGKITGSVNPTDRQAGVQRLWTAGAPRPVVNADWGDYWILFRPDGTVEVGPPMQARIWSFYRGFQAGPGGQQLADRCERIGNENWDSGSPMTSFDGFTGQWSITLATDAEHDTDHFSTAREAIASLLPACRVSINPYGIVTVTQVGQSLPKGAVLDDTITDWQSSAQTDAHYGGCMRSENGVNWGQPVSTAITEDMLTLRRWWLKP